MSGMRSDQSSDQSSELSSEQKGGQGTARNSEREKGRSTADLGPVGFLLQDERITEILINGPGPVWAERDGRVAPTVIELGPYDIELLIERILTPLGLRVDRTAPMVDARLLDGSRVNIVVPPLAIDGPVISIRRFPPLPIPAEAFGPPSMVRVLAGLMSARASILVVGGTSSGKTTLLNALTAMADPAERIVSIEDTAELRLAGDNVVRLEARPANSEGVGEVTLRRLVLNALRMRPDRLVVGEVRGAEAFDLLLAMTSGHRGCLTSCHAADGAGAIRRLETLAALAGTGLGPSRLRALIDDAVQAVVVTERNGSDRLVTAIELVEGGEQTRLWSPAGVRPLRLSA